MKIGSQVTSAKGTINFCYMDYNIPFRNADFYEYKGRNLY